MLFGVGLIRGLCERCESGDGQDEKSSSSQFARKPKRAQANSLMGLRVALWLGCPGRNGEAVILFLRAVKTEPALHRSDIDVMQPIGEAIAGIEWEVCEPAFRRCDRGANSE